MRRRSRGAATAALAAAALTVLGWPGAAAAQDEMPAGHPSVDDSAPRAHGMDANGMFQPPEDTEVPDGTLAPGTIVVDLRDADDTPVAGETVNLGMLINSIAKGDSRKHLQAVTDGSGRATFSGLETASNIAYRVSSGHQGGSFAASPFQLQQTKAMRVTLHVYPVTRDIREARVVFETTLAAEVRDERIQVEEVLTVYNVGRNAWQPDGVSLSLPESYTAFNAQASMSDQGVDDAGGSAKLRGTFPPGRHTVDFRWQLPWSGERDVDFDVGLPPHAAIVRVMMPAAAGVKLVPAGFPPAETRQDGQGQSFLVTERRVRPDEGRLTSVSVGIHDMPTAGSGRAIATTLAAGGVAVGLLFATTRRKRRLAAPLGAREALLQELAELEQARAEGEVGPQTYERTRRELIDSLARLLLVERAST
jgi:hypothetical protein